MDSHTVLIQVLIDQVEQLVAQIVFLHQVAGLADCGFVGYWLSLGADRVPAGTLRVRIKWLGGSAELFPGDNDFYIVKKLLLARFLAVSLEAIRQLFCFIGSVFPVNGFIRTLSRAS